MVELLENDGCASVLFWAAALPPGGPCGWDHHHATGPGETNPEYRGWVEGYARNHKIPMLKAEKGVSKEECVRPHLQRMERRNQHGVYCIFTSMEMGSTFTSKMPKFPTEDPDYRIIRRVPSRFGDSTEFTVKHSEALAFAHAAGAAFGVGLNWQAEFESDSVKAAVEKRVLGINGTENRVKATRYLQTGAGVSERVLCATVAYHGRHLCPRVLMGHLW